MKREKPLKAAPLNSPGAKLPDGSGKCPSEETLRQHLLGQTTGILAETLDKHFSVCPACLATAESCEGSDPLESHVAKAQSERLEIDAKTQSLIDRWKNIPSPKPTVQAQLPTIQAQPSSMPPSSIPPPSIPGFHIIGEIGKGGMGVVFKAEDLKLKRFVALKLIQTGAGSEPELLQRFRSEAEAVARLTHPNILRIYDVGDAEGRPYLSLEYIDGPNLAEFQNAQVVGPTLAARLVEDIAHAMQHAHQAGIIHRDLKPANILITRDDAAPLRDHQSTDANSALASAGEAANAIVPKIVDFGLAKLLDGDFGQTRTGAVVGTPAFMSPEQAAGKLKLVDERSDIYSIGAIFYELLVGRPPFVGESHGETLLMVISDEVVPPKRLRPRLPLDLNTICMKCLAKEPDKRYASAELLAEDLQRFREGRAIRARAVGLWEQSWRWCRRNPIVAMLTTACLVILLASLCVVGWKNYQLGQTNQSLSQAENRATTAQRLAEKQRDEARRRQAELTIRNGLRMMEEEQVAQGLHTLLEGLNITSGDPTMSDWDRVARTNLGSWAQWTPEFETPLAPPGQVARHFALSRYESQFAVVSEHDQGASLIVYDLHSNRALGPPLELNGKLISALTFLPGDGQLVIGTHSVADLQTGTADEVALQIIDITSGKIANSLAMTERVHKLWLPDSGEYLVACCYGPSMQCWRRDGWELLTRRKIEAYGICFDRKREQAVLSNGKRLQLPQLKAVNADTSLAPMQSAAYVHQSNEGLIAYRWLDGKHTMLQCLRDGEGLETAGNDLTASVRPADVIFDRFPSQAHLDGRRAFGLMADRALHSWDWGTARHFPTPLFDGTNVGPAILTSDERTAIASWRFSLGRPLARPFSRAQGKPTSRYPAGSHLGPMVQRVVFDHARQNALIREYELAPGNGTARIVDVKTGQTMGMPIEIRGEDLRAVRFSPDDRLIATSGHKSGVPSGEVNLWDAKTGQNVLGPLRHANWVSTLEFSPDGKLLAAGDYQGQVRFWDVDRGIEVRSPIEHNEIIWSLAWSPDGSLLAVGTTQDFNRSPHIKIWNIAKDVCIAQFKGRGDLMEFSRAGDQLVVSAFNDLRVLDIAMQKEVVRLSEFPQDLRQFRLMRNGSVIATGAGNGQVILWSAETGKALSPPMRHRACVTTLAVSPDESMLIAGTDDGNAQLWDLQTFLPLGPPVAHSQPIAGVAFAQDNRSFITASFSGHVRRWPVPKPARGTVDLLRERLQLWTFMEPSGAGGHEFLGRQRWEELHHAWSSRPPADRASVKLYDPTTDLDWHLARVADAEEDFFKRTASQLSLQPFIAQHVARWHLKKLIALEPSNWIHYARLARAHHGNFESADRAYEECAKFCSPTQLENWYRHRVRDCELADDTIVAKWYLDRLISHGVASADIFEKRARCHERLGDSTAARADEERAVGAGACDDLLIDLALSRGADGEWQEANRLLNLVREPTLTIPDRSLPCGLIRLKAEDEVGFRQFCHALVLASQQTQLSPTHSFAVAEVCASGPCQPADAEAAAASMSRLLREGYKISQQIRSPALLRRMRAHLLVRAGKTPELQPAISVTQPGSITPEAWLDACFQVMAEYRLKAGGGAPTDSAIGTPESKLPEIRLDSVPFWTRIQCECMQQQIHSFLP